AHSAHGQQSICSRESAGLLQGPKGRHVLVGLVATLLVGLSTVLARCPGSDWFEYCFAAALAHQDPAHELEVRPISDVAVCWFLALSAEDHAIEALHGTRDRVRGRRVGE